MKEAKLFGKYEKIRKNNNSDKKAKKKNVPFYNTNYQLRFEEV